MRGQEFGLRNQIVNHTNDGFTGTEKMGLKIRI
jgi:hypothetical protein